MRKWACPVRLAIPARFRPQIEGGAALSRGVEKCLYVYQLDAWEQKGSELAASNPNPKIRRMLMHRFFSTSDACELDAQGRIIIPAKFRQYAGLNGEAVVVGVHDHFEIWSPTEWERYNEEMEQEDLSILQLPFEAGDRTREHDHDTSTASDDSRRARNTARNSVNGAYAGDAG